MANETITFDQYQKELAEQGYRITGLTGLKFAFRMARGKRLDETELAKYTVREARSEPAPSPEPTPAAQPQKKTRKETPQSAIIGSPKPKKGTANDLSDLNRLISSKEETEPKTEKKKKKQREKKPRKLTYEERLQKYREEYKDDDKRVLIFPNQAVYILKEAPQTEPEPKPEKQHPEERKKVKSEKEKPIQECVPLAAPPQQTSEKPEPVAVSSLEQSNTKAKPQSLYEEFAAPFEQWITEDLDENNQPKRSLKTEQKTPNEINITITPAENLAAKGDSGARINIKKEAQNTHISIGPDNQNPLSYEYLQKMLANAAQNGQKTIVLADIKTVAFRDKLLAAALEAGMKIEKAPDGIDLTAGHIKELPENAQKLLRKYNKEHHAAIDGRKTENITQNIMERKQQLNSPKKSGKPNIKRNQKKNQTNRPFRQPEREI